MASLCGGLLVRDAPDELLGLALDQRAFSPRPTAGPSFLNWAANPLVSNSKLLICSPRPPCRIPWIRG